MDKLWETTTANEFLTKIAKNNRKIAIKCSQKSCKKQQENLALHYLGKCWIMMENTLEI